ncbi:hypothetical protein [Priestia megaterium]|uniref:hypothetical protein n=1 Tax=Priestia megaterium TaxID=1404 RepID=UPI002E1DCF77|nr:hypothetical protein [Priestia megaterium]
MDTCKNIIYGNGATCDFCNAAIGDRASKVDKLYITEKYYDQGETFKLCQKDYDEYLRFLEEEKEAYINLVNVIGYEALGEHQRGIYNCLVN